MRGSAGSGFLGFVAVGTTLGIFAGVTRADHEVCLADPADESCLNHTLALPVVANDDFFVPVDQMSVQAGCVSRPVPATPNSFTMVGFDVVGAPDNFFYSHSFTMYNSEPFTHTGVLNAQLDGPGGPYAAAGDIFNGEAVLDFGLLAGPGTYTVTLPGNSVPVHPGSSTTEFDVPGDCVPYTGWTLGWDSGFDNVLPRGLESVELHGTLNVKNGACPPFTTDFVVTLFPDGTASSFQPDTLDTNQGYFFPGTVGTGPQAVVEAPDPGMSSTLFRTRASRRPTWARYRQTSDRSLDGRPGRIACGTSTLPRRRSRPTNGRSGKLLGS